MKTEEKFRIEKKLINEKIYYRIYEKTWVEPKRFLWWTIRDGYWDWFVVTKVHSTGQWDEYSSGLINIPINFKTLKKANEYINNLKYK